MVAAAIALSATMAMAACTTAGAHAGRDGPSTWRSSRVSHATLPAVRSTHRVTGACATRPPLEPDDDAARARTMFAWRPADRRAKRTWSGEPLR